MAGIFTRGALDKIMTNADLTPEQRTEQVFSLYGRALDEGLVHALNFLRLAIHRVLHGGGEDAVLAVLRPGLGNHFQLHIRGVADNLAENLLHHQHILGGKGKFHVLAQLRQLGLAQITNRNGTICCHNF